MFWCHRSKISSNCWVSLNLLFQQVSLLINVSLLDIKLRIRGDVKRDPDVLASYTWVLQHLSFVELFLAALNITRDLLTVDLWPHVFSDKNSVTALQISETVRPTGHPGWHYLGLLWGALETLTGTLNTYLGLLICAAFPEFETSCVELLVHFY